MDVRTIGNPFVVVTTGLPINDRFDDTLLVAASLVVVVGSVGAPSSRGAAVLAAAVAVGQALLPRWKIEEGRNEFLPGPDARKTSGLPVEFQYLDHQFAGQNTPEKRCADLLTARPQPC